MKNLFHAGLLTALLCGPGLLPSPALASAPGEQVLCTNLPESQWIGEKRIRQIFGEKDYASISFKVSRTHCYEFYAIRKDGDIVEAYYNPANGDLVKFNRVAKDGHYNPAGTALKPAAASPAAQPASTKPPALTAPSASSALPALPASRGR